MKAAPAAAAAGAVQPQAPVLMETLYDLLYRSGLEDRALASTVEGLAGTHGAAVYSELIHLLSHLRFDPDEAKTCWTEILTHRDRMQQRLEATVDLRVALVSYFLDVNRKLRNPKVIELQVFEQTQASAYRDALTGLWNFRYFRDYLAREVDRGRRHSPPLSLVMVDIDDFKRTNDRLGHEEGNRILAAIARLLSESLRSIDVAARYGGEEFALVLPTTSKESAQIVAERARRKVEGHPFAGEGAATEHVTVSMGVATFPADAADAEGLVRCADSAMYAAKTRGKNQIHLFGENRRSYRRIDAALDGTFAMLAADLHPLTTVNISEGGLLFIAQQWLPVGCLIDITLSVPGTDRRVTATGRVIRVEEQGEGRYQAALRVIDMSVRDRTLLSKYLGQSGSTTPKKD